MRASDLVEQVKDRLVGGSGKGGGGGDEDDDRKGKQPASGGPAIEEDDDDRWMEVNRETLAALEELMRLLEAEFSIYGYNQDLWAQRYVSESPELLDLIEDIFTTTESCDIWLREDEYNLVQGSPNIAEMQAVMHKCRDMVQTLMARLQQAQRLLRELRSGGGSSSSVSTSTTTTTTTSTNNNNNNNATTSAAAGGHGGGESLNLLSALTGLESQFSATAWLEATKATSGGKKCVFVDAVLAKHIAALFESYTSSWNKASTDGFKDMKIQHFRRMTEILEEIVRLLVKSGNIQTLASIGPGSAFFDMLQRLSRQSCGDREVLTLSTWWKNIVKDSKPSQSQSSSGKEEKASSSSSSSSSRKPPRK